MASRPAAKAKTPAKVAAPVPSRKKPAKTAARSAAPPKANIAAVVTLKNLAEELAAAHDLSKKMATAMLEDVVQRVTLHLKDGDRIRFGGLGILEVRNRPARMGRNPATGEAVQIKASKKVAFRPAKALKEVV